jgi:hypothetical protein
MSAKPRPKPCIGGRSTLNFGIQDNIRQKDMATLYTDQAHCIIELLSRSSVNEERRVSGTFYRFEHQQLLLATGQQLSPASAVTVEHEDVLFLGEVVACTPEAEGVWKVVIRVRQLLNSLQSLTILRERLLWREGHSCLSPLTEPSVLVGT